MPQIKSITLQELLALWLRENRGLIREETMQVYANLMEVHVLPFFAGGLEISQAQVEGFVDAKRGEGLSDVTISACMRVLRRVLEYGASIGLCKAPEWEVSFGTPGRKKEAVILSTSEEKQLVDYLIDNPTEKHLCFFLMLTMGLSIGEVLRLQWKDISFAKNEIKVKAERGPQNSRKKAVRTLPFGERQRIYLQKLASRPENYVCSGAPKPITRAGLEARWRNLVNEQLLPPMTPTCLRHTYAVRCIEAGMDYGTLSRLLGVSNKTAFRKLYGEMVSEDQRERLGQAQLEGRKKRGRPSSRCAPEKDPEIVALESKIEDRKKQLRETLALLDGELDIINVLRNSDCVQGSTRQAFYNFVEKVMGDDKDGQFLVEYLRANMRVANMPLAKTTSVQTIRKRVTRGFEKLSARLDAIYKVED